MPELPCDAGRMVARGGLMRQINLSEFAVGDG
jgi:hypothetical protein